jgi:hypothetical protein
MLVYRSALPSTLLADGAYQKPTSVAKSEIVSSGESGMGSGFIIEGDSDSDPAMK